MFSHVLKVCAGPGSADLTVVGRTLTHETQIVTIEQGGDEHTVNTVSASVYPIEFYSSRGYAPRRKKYW